MDKSKMELCHDKDYFYGVDPSMTRDEAVVWNEVVGELIGIKVVGLSDGRLAFRISRKPGRFIGSTVKLVGALVLNRIVIITSTIKEKFRFLR